MIEIETWLQAYQQAVGNEFGDRVLFIGLQGSYGRKEATDRSDIDVVLILDKVDIEDLIRYRKTVHKLPYRELLCGFVSGRDEIAAWSKADLFQFYFDTHPIKGSLETLISIVTVADARQAVLLGACNIYHACSHNFLHASDEAALRSLYKSAFFVLRAKYYCETGAFLHRKREMKDYIRKEDAAVLQAIMDPACVNRQNFERCTQILLTWSASLIRRYGVL